MTSWQIAWEGCDRGAIGVIVKFIGIGGVVTLLAGLEGSSRGALLYRTGVLLGITLEGFSDMITTTFSISDTNLTIVYFYTIL